MKKFFRSLILTASLFGASMLLSQISKIDVTIHARVDTSKQEIKTIAQLWINYLQSKPDSAYDNPYWNSVEKRKYKQFDFSANYMYQFPSEQLLQYYKPTILSIEKEGNYYGIRTLFAADGLTDIYRKSNPWCITKLYATKENDVWKLKNALPVITEKWERKTIGRITFVYPPQHLFNKEMAVKANLFCEDISKTFQFPDWNPFEFYITDSGDELGKLLNFDYYFAGYTTGIGLNNQRILLSGMGSEFYPHEFIHLIVPKNKRHWLIEEGFATWKGGQGGKSFEESAIYFANALAKNDTVSFEDVLTKKWGWQYAAFYTSGAIFCKAAFEKGGIEMLKQLLNVPNQNEKLIEVICTIFNLKQSALDIFWRNEVLKYKTH